VLSSGFLDGITLTFCLRSSAGDLSRPARPENQGGGSLTGGLFVTIVTNDCALRTAAGSVCNLWTEGLLFRAFVF